MKKCRNWMCGAVIATVPTVVFAEIKSVRLDLVETTFISATMKTYSHEGVVHSVLIEAKTDYGDDLPYVFINCDFPRVSCVSHLVGDDYRYRIEGDGKRVRLITESAIDDFKTIDVFQLAD